MQIQLREGWVWRRSWDVRASTAANDEGGRFDGNLKMPREDDLAKVEEEISWTRRRIGTAPAETGKGWVSLHSWSELITLRHSRFEPLKKGPADCRGNCRGSAHSRT